MIFDDFRVKMKIAKKSEQHLQILNGVYLQITYLKVSSISVSKAKNLRFTILFWRFLVFFRKKSKNKNCAKSSQNRDFERYVKRQEKHWKFRKKKSKIWRRKNFKKSCDF